MNTHHSLFLGAKAVEPALQVSTAALAVHIAADDLELEFDTAFQSLLSVEDLRQQTDRVRALAAQKATAPPEQAAAAAEAYRVAKEALPAVMISGHCLTRRRGASAEERQFTHNGLFQLDFDKVPADRLAALRQRLSDCPHVCLAYRSPGGSGLKALYLVKLPEFTSREEMEAWHRGIFRSLVQASLAQFGHPADPATASPYALCFLCHDPEPVSRWNAVPDDTITPAPAPEPAPASTEPAASRPEEEQLRRILAEISSDDPRPDRAKWLQVSFAVFHAIGTADGIPLIEEYFPPEEQGEYLDLAAGFDPARTDWRRLRVWAPQAFREIPVFTPIEDEDEDSPAPAPAAPGKTLKLPRPVLGADLLVSWPDPVPPVIEGVIGQGERLMIAAPSKAGKTWAMLSLAKAVTDGGEWFGFQCRPGRVLFVNFELSPNRITERLRKFTRRSGQNGLEQVEFVNLRGAFPDWQSLDDHIRELHAESPFALIILDPIYKMLRGANEKDNGEMAEMLAALDRISAATGVAVAFAHHFSKGNKAGADSMDRASGAGVFARDPDAILTLTPHETPDCFVLEATVRNYQRPPASVWRFVFPEFQPVDLDPAALKGKAGAKKKGSVADVVALLGDGPMEKRQLIAKLEARGMSDRTAARLIREAETAGRVTITGKTCTATDSASTSAQEPDEI